MPVLSRLVDIYESRGFRVSSGLNPVHFDNYALAPSTWLIKEGSSYTNGLGIGLQEVYFLECLFADFNPKNIFIIGNSLGWSTVALSLINAKANVVAIDDGSDKNALEGITFTNTIAAEEGLSLKVVQGRSPEDVGPAIDNNFQEPVDFVFIDGCHTNDHIVIDFMAIQAKASPDCVYLFHDVHQFKLDDGFNRILTDSGLIGRILLSTPSGVGIAFNPNSTPAVARAIEAFDIDEEALAVIEKEAWQARHRHRTRYRRSLIKRLNSLRRLFGLEAKPLDK
jgi:hypothetical protein